MLSEDILNAVKAYTQNMSNKVSLVLQTGEHQKRNELKEFLTELSSVSDNLIVVERDENLRSPITFYLEVEGKNNGIHFSGIPSGHEFNSLILAILQSSGTDLKLDGTLTKMVQKITEDLHFEVFISLSCHNCPDVVQSLNQFALLNDRISSEMIDGGLFKTLIDERNIQGVPSVYLNGKLFANGKIDTAQLVDKLIERFPYIIDGDDNEQLPLQDVTVIGAGPAGVAAAIYAARKGLNVTIIADRFGGQVKDTVGIENLISVSKTTGTQLTGNMQAHLNDYEITTKEFVRVEKIEKGQPESKAPKKLHLSSGEVIESKTVIIATGAKWRELGIPGEKENIGSGVAYCPHCDGPFFKGKDVAVVGGGNSGIEAALDLASMVNHVTVFEFLPGLKADNILVEKAEAHKKITIIKNVATKEVIAENGKVVALAYEDRATGEMKQQSLSGIFIQIGLLPNSDFLQGVVECTKYGEVIIDEKCHTSEPGIFAAGDVSTVPYKQIVIAMGEGAKASLSAFDYLIRES
ncbi:MULTISPECIES: alkyl hydroperoxide reductase subunit F [unclassified Colwellia]|uniref:alkyl hydroperoxide reductase subunit F n=1 Tax=unclassified Colwellia TaxID=196834 RepID=UPI0015F3B9FB|nr:MULTISPECIES: alkyl hydroperoxide reductase subunit F [unclassified Colwellia]MBA6233212.1 alkyl hydroperoxide reductase subunit F [Colwellia sp. MB02u-7]MBA6236302.1 alkyl hydroperoxide reductase subunit F [Colwellia sp. MB02u-11]MBA6256836.1 alkyl hydroperoxide reductase subunit F [Colwellia sp. MB3u-28]MBA6261158.1 alkyl hydroperoxide reductase subunit F [Colwellia sp. MB3u-41]MBA6298298.1 alkyl hydroperoxide reductase subunit F [Colwellia sp. MB3u-22]